MDCKIPTYLTFAPIHNMILDSLLAASAAFLLLVAPSHATLQAEAVSARTVACNNSPLLCSTFPFLLSEFHYVFGTMFGVTSLSGFSCTLQRPSTLSSSASAMSSGYMGLVNQFADTAEAFGITIPDVDNITTTNSPSTSTTWALGLNSQECESEWGVKTTFMLVDFWNVGPGIETADYMNGIVATGRTNVTTAELTSSSRGIRRRERVGWSRTMIIAITIATLRNLT
jgi:hypothetical protein